MKKDPLPSEYAATAETAAPARNFALPVEQRVRAIVGGPPAHVRRKRAIEDMQAGIVRTLATLCDAATARGIDPRAHARERAPSRALESLRELIDRHNRWYPIEANLPIHPRTGQLVERTGEPWQPMSAPTLDELIGEALRRAMCALG